MKKVMVTAVLIGMTVLGGQKVMASGAGAGYGNFIGEKAQEDRSQGISRENINLLKKDSLKSHR